MAVEAGLTPLARSAAPRRLHPLAVFVLRRLGFGLLTLFLVSVLVFAATEVLPGNAARAVLGKNATPQALHAMEVKLHLTGSVVGGYWHWISGLVEGHLGVSLVNGTSVSSLVGPRLESTAVLVLCAGLIGSLLGVGAGVLAASRRDRWFDSSTSIVALVMSALPEVVVALMLIIIFSTVLLHLFPGVSVFPPGNPPWDHVDELVLPVATLVLLVFPYIFRMTRATMIEALASEYCEVAELKGMPRRRVLLSHALPNAFPAIVQVIALSLVFLAGGVIVVEFVFNYQGLGQGLVESVSTRDIPMIQCIVLVLAAFYVLVNIVADALALAATPRRRLPRSG